MKKVFRPRTEEVFLLIVEGMRSICARVELITCTSRSKNGENVAHPICAPTTPPHSHNKLPTLLLSVFTASNICKSRKTAILLPLLLLLLPSLSFNCTTTRLEWTIGLFMCILFCHTKDSYVHRSRRGWINRPVSHGPPLPPTGC